MATEDAGKEQKRTNRQKRITESHRPLSLQAVAEPRAAADAPNASGDAEEKAPPAADPGTPSGQTADTATDPPLSGAHPASPPRASQALEPLRSLAPSLPRGYRPPVTELRQWNTSRLLPARYSESVLTRIADSDADLQLIYELDHATNERLLAEGNQRLGLSSRELVFAVPAARIINAAFAHPHPQGARFSTPYRGAWYAAFELATAKAEVLFHRSVQLNEIRWDKPESLDYDQYYADFAGPFHDLRPQSMQAILKAGGTDRTDAMDAESELGRRACLDPRSYVASQQLSVELLEAGSLGVVYPSIRRAAGTCVACFRPSMVAHVRKRDLHRLTWYPDASSTFVRVPRGTPEANLQPV